MVFLTFAQRFKKKFKGKGHEVRHCNSSVHESTHCLLWLALSSNQKRQWEAMLCQIRPACRAARDTVCHHRLLAAGQRSEETPGDVRAVATEPLPRHLL